ncbi:hypothetical protein Tco_0569479 [Tanacetum coccineum]
MVSTRRSTKKGKRSGMTAELQGDGGSNGKLVVGSVLYACMLGKKEKVIACTSCQLKVLMKDCMTNVLEIRGQVPSGKANVDVVPWSRKKSESTRKILRDRLRRSTSRDVRTLAIEEAYTIKYSIHPGADMMLYGFRLTNRWLSMKKDIASCGSKYLTYLEVEVEYQGSSGLLLQPELPELRTSMVDFRGNWNTHFREDEFFPKVGDYQIKVWDVLHLKAWIMGGLRSSPLERL